MAELLNGLGLMFKSAMLFWLKTRTVIECEEKPFSNLTIQQFNKIN